MCNGVDVDGGVADDRLDGEVCTGRGNGECPDAFGGESVEGELSELSLGERTCGCGEGEDFGGAYGDGRRGFEDKGVIHFRDVDSGECRHGVVDREGGVGVGIGFAEEQRTDQGIGEPVSAVQEVVRLEVYLGDGHGAAVGIMEDKGCFVCARVGVEEPGAVDGTGFGTAEEFGSVVGFEEDVCDYELAAVV